VGIIAVSDLCVSVDTGPLHVAAALGIPTLAIEQAHSISGRILGDQTDWSSVGRDLKCLGCAEMICPIDATNPPCSWPEPEKISKAIGAKLEAVTGNRISAIIPVLHPQPRLLRCIEAVRDQVDEIVITLDGDADLDGFIDPDPKIVVVPNPTRKRTGCGHTMGRAMRHSTGRFLLLLNDDAYADPGSVMQLRRAMTEKVAVVGALTRYGNGRIYHGGTRRHGTGFGHIDHNAWMGEHSIRARTEMEFVNLAFALVLRDAYFDVRGFDQRYDCYSEDSDFCMSVRKSGWKVMYEPGATAIHDEGQSTTSAQKFELLRAGNAMLANKWWNYFQRNANNQLGSFT
jgi:GT2 family glycosyltransferase